MVLLQSLQTNTHTFTEREHVCKKDHFTLNKTIWRGRILVQTELFMGIFMFIHKK